MGHLVWHRSASHGKAAHYNDVTMNTATRETLTYDALGNITWSARSDTTCSSGGGGGGCSYTGPGSGTPYQYQAGTGRLLVQTEGQVVTSRYDSAGSIRFVQTGTNLAPSADHVSFYGADGKLRATETRQLLSGTMAYKPYTMVFEDYRYDALGRRVLVRTRRWCVNASPGLPEEECRFSTIRRTLWDGDRELYEIQMPGGQAEPASVLENDVDVVVRASSDALDPNPFFGRVVYTYGLGVDQPLGITRINYADRSQVISTGGTLPSQIHRTVDPFTIVPLWDARGQADAGVFADDGAARKCITNTSGEIRCIYLDWPYGWYAYARRSYRPGFWHGTLTTDKRDGSGMLYRRNRYYDPSSGRFTQEDPIGLAGGLNAYGFANGDPVSYSDPYGLSGCNWLKQTARCMAERLRQEMAKHGHNVTKLEAEYYVGNPEAAAAAALAVRTASGFANRMASAYPGKVGVANAARHQYGQCLMTQFVGEDVARTTADLHEAEASDREDSQRDQANNRIGRAIGRRSRALGCAAAVEANIASGNYDWDANSAGQYLNPNQ